MLNLKKQREKGTTTQITIGFSAYQMILDYLFATECSFLNYFDARITDTDLNYTFKLYEIKPDNIEFCSDSGCQMTLPLREIDDYKSILEKLSINEVSPIHLIDIIGEEVDNCVFDF